MSIVGTHSFVLESTAPGATLGVVIVFVGVPPGLEVVVEFVPPVPTVGIVAGLLLTTVLDGVVVCDVEGLLGVVELIAVVKGVIVPPNDPGMPAIASVVVVGGGTRGVDDSTKPSLRRTDKNIWMKIADTKISITPRRL